MLDLDRVKSVGSVTLVFFPMFLGALFQDLIRTVSGLLMNVGFKTSFFFNSFLTLYILSWKCYLVFSL